MADRDKNFLNSIITGDNMLLYTQMSVIRIEIKIISLYTEVYLDKTRGKIMFEIFVDSHGILYYEFIPQCQTVNKQIFVDIFCH